MISKIIPQGSLLYSCRCKGAPILMKKAPVLTGVLILVIEKRSPTVQRLKALGLHIGRFGWTAAIQ